MIQKFEEMARQMKGLNSQGHDQKFHMTQEQINQQILQAAEMQYQQLKQKMSKNEKFIDIPFVGTSQVPNLLPPLAKSKYNMDISSLKEITARKLEFKRNEGYFLKVKVIKRPWKFPGPGCGINVIFKDKNEDIVRASFYNVVNTEDWKKLEELFFMGREVVILHPFYKVAMDGIVNVRVENRYEFYFADAKLSKFSSPMNFTRLLEESKALKDEANKCLKTDKNKALEKYHKSLEVFLKQRPRYAFDESEFLLEWKINLQEQEKKTGSGTFLSCFLQLQSCLYRERPTSLGVVLCEFQQLVQ